MLQMLHVVPFMWANQHSVGELKDSTFPTRQGAEQKLLSKRDFIINDGYGEIACEMLCDAHALLHDVFVCFLCKDAE